MKPEAPAEYRGLWKPIRDQRAGLRDQRAVPACRPRSPTSSRSSARCTTTPATTSPAATPCSPSRGGASGADTTGQVPVDRLDRHRRPVGRAEPGMPAYAAVPYAASIGLRPGYFGANYLGIEHNPFETDGDPNAANFQVAEHQPGRRPDGRPPGRPPRRCCRTSTSCDATSIRGAMADAMDRFERKAYDMVTGAGRPQGLRHRLGRRRDCATATAGRNLGPEHAAWPGGWSRPAPPSSPSTSGGWDHHWDLKAGHGRTTCRRSTGSCPSLFTDLERARPARQRAGRAVRRVQPHAADERRRQRRPALQHGHARPRPLGQRHVLPDGRRRRARGARSSARPTASAKSPKDRPARPPATSTPRSTTCWASTRTSASSTTPAAPCPPSTRVKSFTSWCDEQAATWLGPL